MPGAAREKNFPPVGSSKPKFGLQRCRFCLLPIVGMQIGALETARKRLGAAIW
jgi:hypothetical protein